MLTNDHLSSETPPVSVRRTRLLFWGLAAWGLAGLWLVWALHRPSVLFFDLGWGDSSAAGREFQGDWWRFEVRGETAYRWTGSEAHITSPVVVRGRNLMVEWRCARFAPGATPVTLAAGGRTIARWEQDAQNEWMRHRAQLGAYSGLLEIDVRASRRAPRPNGIALDWVRVTGVECVWPTWRSWGGIACLILGVPVVLALITRGTWPLAVLSPGLVLLLGAGVLADTAGAVSAFAIAGPRALVATTIVGAGSWLAAKWKQRLGRDGHLSTALWVPTLAVILASLALSSPRYDYPDVETHGRYLSGIRRSPRWAIDPRPYQQAVRAWTRVIDGKRVGFPYSSAFHVASWPLAPMLGDVGAIVAVACTVVGLSLLLVYHIGRVSGLAPPGALAAQIFFAILPVTTSRLTLALWPSLLGQCLELGVIALVMTRPVRLDGGGGVVRWTAALAAVQVGYVGGILDASAVVVAAAIGALVVRHRAWAIRILACQAAAGAIVLAGQHWYFLPTLWHVLLPALIHGGRGPGGGAGAVGGFLGEAHELVGFFGGGIVLIVAGAYSWRRVAPRARRVLGVVMAGAALLSAGRAVFPTLLGDAKVVELLAMPVAVGMGWGLVGLWSGSWRRRSLAAGGVALLVIWSVVKAYRLYAFHAMVAVL